MGGLEAVYGLRLRGFALALIMSGMASGAWAQTTTTPASPASPAPATPSVAQPAQPAPAAPATPPPAATEATPNASADTSISQTIDVQPRPAVILNGTSTWDNGFKTLTDAFDKLNDAISKNNLASAGHPLAVFTSTDDAGFKFSAEIPIAQAPDGKTEISPDIKIGETPGGKAIRFQHRASYDDIDSTYEAITAYLDEKGLEAQNLFAEEYLKMTKSPDDPSMEVDIYVFLK